MDVLLGLLVVLEMLVASAPGNNMDLGIDSALAKLFQCTEDDGESNR
jgi:hypothetical protein